MLEMLIVIFPAVIACLTYRIFHSKINMKDDWKKILALIVVYALISNLLILGGLRWIGMKSFNLFHMSVRFKLKWLGLELGFGVVLTMIYGNFKCIYEQKLSILRQFKKLFPSVLFLNITYAVFTPSSLFLNNIKEFTVSYLKVFPVLLGMVLVLTLGIYLVALFFTNENNVIYIGALFFSAALCLYVQGNFLNPELPVLDGTGITWSDYTVETIVSTVFWCICIAGILLAVCFRKDKMEKVIKYTSYFLSLVQLVSLVVLVLVNPLDKTVDHGMLKEGEFALGSKENIVMFIVDTLQADTLNEYLMSEAYVDGRLDDFTFFNDAVSGGAPTEQAVPLLLTGYEYEPRQSIEEYREEAWQETALYDDLHENGYDVRMYTTLDTVRGCNEKMIDNYGITGSHWIVSYPMFGMQLYKLVNFYLFPQPLKKFFWLSSDVIANEIGTSSMGYTCNDPLFYNELRAADVLKTDYEKAFRMYHFWGVHSPRYMNADLEVVEEGNVPEQETLQGIMKIIYAYIDEMKKAEVYDESMIIILGDHGKHKRGNIESNPAVLIKRPGESHVLEYSSAPIHFRNIVATMASNIMDDYSGYGPSVYDIDENSDVERMHTIGKSVRNRNVFEEPYDDSLDCVRVIISGKSDGGEYHVYDPFSINRIPYSIGEIVDFESNNAYAKQLEYRLYKEDGAAIASNELNICFNLSESSYEKSKKDFVFHFVYSDVYNDSQLMRVYVNAKKMEYVTCLKEDCGMEKTVTIPSQFLEDGKLAIRMVFPGAVTPKQLDPDNSDTRVLSVAFKSMWVTQ